LEGPERSPGSGNRFIPRRERLKKALSSTTRKGKAKKKGTKAEVVEAAEKVEKAVEEEVEKEVKKVERAVDRSAERPKAKAAGQVGRAPFATVLARHRGGTISRHGRGFSFGELSSAGLSAATAARWGARVDYRRGSVVEGNVSALKVWASSQGAAAKAERKPGGQREQAGQATKDPESSAKKEAKSVGRVAKPARKTRRKPEP
jgi:ribosomal protein L13E